MDNLDDLALIKTTRAHRAADMSATTAWRRQRDDPTFPKAIQTGPGSFAYRLSEWRAWIENRPRRNVTKAG